MNGFDIKLLAQKTNIKENTLKTWLNKYPELKEMPYSIKSSGRRIFFPPIIKWIESHLGISESFKSLKYKTNEAFKTAQVTASLIVELKEIYPVEELKKRLDFLMGYPPGQIGQPIQQQKFLPDPLSQSLEVCKGVIGENKHTRYLLL